MVGPPRCLANAYASSGFFVFAEIAVESPSAWPIGATSLGFRSGGAISHSKSLTF